MTFPIMPKNPDQRALDLYCDILGVPRITVTEFERKYSDDPAFWEAQEKLKRAQGDRYGIF